METKPKRNMMEHMLSKFGLHNVFIVNVGSRGGLALYWKGKIVLKI